MAAQPLLPDPNALTLDSLCIRDGVIIFTVHTTRQTVACSLCRCPSARIHSRYRRTLLDLPWQGHGVRMEVTSRKFFCDNRECARRIFTEPLPSLAGRYARKTQRLADALRELTFLVGGEAAARIACAFGLLVSPDALLNSLKKAPPSAVSTPRVLGVDDFAFRKGRTYGTILLDMEKRRPIDLLPDREGATLKAWLLEHPGVQIVTRDRGATYIDAITAAAPHAQQVADRFHLLQNLAEAFTHWLARQMPQLRKALLPEQKSAADGDFLIVIGEAAFPLRDYALRWGIETMFAAFKSRGFRLEDTHLTCPERLSRLLGLLAVAYCWAFVAGRWLAQVKPLKVKKHGRMPVSLVRRGLDFLRPIAVQLCASVNKGNVAQTMRFLSCT